MKHSSFDPNTLSLHTWHVQSPACRPAVSTGGARVWLPGFASLQLKQNNFVANTLHWQFGHVQSPGRTSSGSPTGDSGCANEKRLIRYAAAPATTIDV